MLPNLDKYPLGIKQGVLHDLLVMAERVSEDQHCDSVGICNQLSLDLRGWQDLLRDVWKFWPEFSGDPCFPVPSPLADCCAEEYYYHCKAEGGSMWGRNSDYGKSRQELLAFLISTLRASIAEGEQYVKEKEIVFEKIYPVVTGYHCHVQRDALANARHGDEVKLTITRPKPKKKLDWSKMPKDTLVVVGDKADDISRIRYLSCVYAGSNFPFSTKTCETSSLNSQVMNLWRHCKLAPAEEQPWHVWFGGECPLPEGVKVEYLLQLGNKHVAEACKLGWAHCCGAADIIAYKIIGLVDGYEY